ncbi:MICOS complex subunit Mic60p [Trichomonascus vanleenenianus]|uniref:Mic60p n=1 Tax=Trichomonascus vanleenenianus TaxID=2268995 RepID=UPI003ECB3447
MLRVRQIGSRAFNSSARRLQAAVEEPLKQLPPKKKSSVLRRLLVAGATVATMTYGAGVYYSLRDDKFHDLFTEYVPLSDKVITFIEEQKFRAQIGTGKPIDLSELLSKDKTKAAPPTGEVVKVAKSGAEAREVEEAAPLPPHLSALSGPRKEDDSITKQSSLIRKVESLEEAPKKPQEKPVELPKPSEAGLPLIHLPAESDTLVGSAVESLNKFIHSVNKSTHTSESIEAISSELAKLGDSIRDLRQRHKAELKESLEEQATKFQKLSESHQADMQKTIGLQQDQVAQQLQQEEERLIALYNARLLREIEVTKKAVATHANSVLIAAHAEQEMMFAGEVAERVEKERHGRLGKIEELSKSVESLQQLSLTADEAIKHSQSVARYHVAVNQLSHVLAVSDRPVPLGGLLAKVKEAANGDELITSALSALPEEVSSQGVLSTAQLTARLRLLEPEIRKASLLPPNAGIAGHLGSWVFSHLLWKKEGAPVGDDVESILARAETALVEGRVRDAVGEVNSLQGWPKKLAHDWLEEGRRRSEVEFLVEVLNEEGKLRGI